MPMNTRSPNVRTVVGNISLSLDGCVSGAGGPYDMVAPDFLRTASRDHLGLYDQVPQHRAARCVFCTTASACRCEYLRRELISHTGERYLVRRTWSSLFETGEFSHAKH